MAKLPKIYEPILLADIVSAVREADEGFKKTGGTSRITSSTHWVDDWFLECLSKRGLQIFKAQAVYDLEAENERLRKIIDPFITANDEQLREAVFVHLLMIPDEMKLWESIKDIRAALRKEVDGGI